MKYVYAGLLVAASAAASVFGLVMQPHQSAALICRDIEKGSIVEVVNCPQPTNVTSHG